MNRVIRFKGKRVDNQEWVYGFFWLMNDENNSNKPCITVSDRGADNFQNHEVMPHTVSQWIGVSNIWEGSIVECWDNAADENAMFGKRHRGKIVFSGAAFVLDVDGVLLPHWLNAENIKVLGNIHDNPELLTPLKGERINTMTTDPNVKQAEATEQENAQESASLDQATGADAEEGSVEG